MNTDEILREVQLEYLSGVTGTREEKLKRLPLTRLEDISGILWNLLTNGYWRSKLSVSIFNEIVNKLLQEHPRRNQTL